MQMRVGSILLGQPKIDELYLCCWTLTHKHNVLELQISMDDVSRMQVRDGAHETLDNATCLLFSVRIACIEISATAKLQNKTKLAVIVKRLDCPDNVWMVQRTEDLDWWQNEAT
jgi:hypothetical protein